MPSEEELLTRQMPHSTEAEQSVLGSMLIDARCVPEVIEALRPEDFYLRTNREIYETIYSMFNFSLTIDPVTVLEHMKQNGVYDENTSRNYILQLMEITPTAANVKEYVAIVKDKALLRRIAETAGELTAMVQEGTGTAQEVLEAAEQRIYAIRQGRSAQGLAHISSVILNVYERLNELAASDSAVPGLSTGLPDVDMAISGLNKSDLILLAARPGMGKTSFALNMLLHAGKFSGKTVVFFSLEMSREQLAMRLISGESFVDNKKLVTGKLGEEDWTKIAAASAALNQTQILIDDNPSLSVADMNAKCRRVDNLGLVVIDYLQLMTSAGGPTRSGDNRQQIVSDISRALKIMAKELNVPVVCLSQLSRGPESRSDKRPMLSDLRESGAIEQDADIVMFLYRDDYYNDSDENHNLAECIIAKNRHGETRTVEGRRRPTSDKHAVLYMFRHMPEVNVILHTHQPYATAVGLVSDRLPANLVTVIDELHGEVKVAPFTPSSDEGMGVSAVEYAGDALAVILKHHGVLAYGKDIEQALTAAVYLEEASKTYLAALASGRTIPELTAEQIADESAERGYYGQPDEP